uniref:Small ribosomal subunit protein bS16m n=2 Tax=Knipowitschia caucasica TaxID=637954 RepID=A0AAV2M4F0_KNICA
MKAVFLMKNTSSMFGLNVGVLKEFTPSLSQRNVTCYPSSMVHLSSLLSKQYHGGHVVIRLALAGHNQANRPFYRIVAAFNKRARDGKYMEQLGTYDPLPNIYNEKLVSLNFDRIKYWIGCGAHTSKPVSKLLGLAGFFPLHPMTVTEAERRRAAALTESSREREEEL